MFNLLFQLENPWASERFQNLLARHGRLTKHKSWELDVLRYTPTVLKANVSLTHAVDHAGLSIEVGLLGYDLLFKIYDNRHWSYELGDWEASTQDDTE